MATGIVSIIEQTHKMVKKVTFDWTATTGAAGDTTTKYYDGEVLRVVDMPCNSTGYDLQINDSDGIDLLGGQGDGMTSGGSDFGTSTGVVEMPLSAVSSKITLEVTDSCGGRTGQTIVYIR